MSKININIRKYELCGYILGVLQSVEETFNNYNMPRSSENIAKHIEMLNELIKILKREDNIIH
jgi:flagellin-specific chaperone FliS